MPCFLFPQAPQLSPLVKWHHLWLPGRKKSTKSEGRCFVGLRRADTTQTSLTWKNYKEPNNTSLWQWRPELPNSFPHSWMYLVWKIFRTTAALKTNAMNSLRVSLIRPTVSCCNNFASGTMLVFKVSLCECKLRCLISPISGGQLVIPVLKFIPKNETLVSMDWVGPFLQCITSPNSSSGSASTSAGFGTSGNAWHVTARLRMDTGDPKKESKGSKQIE